MSSQIKNTSKDRTEKSVSEMFPARDFTALGRAVTSQDMDWLSLRLGQMASPTGFQWLLAPEPVPTSTGVPSVDDIMIWPEYISASNKEAFILEVMTAELIFFYHYLNYFNHSYNVYVINVWQCNDNFML